MKIPIFLTAAVATLAWACFAHAQEQAPKTRDREVLDLSKLDDPMRDAAWESEKEWTHAKHVFDPLSKKLIAERTNERPAVAEFFTRNCQVQPLRPLGGKTIASGDFAVRIADLGRNGGIPVEASMLSADPERSFGKLLTPFRTSKDLRFEFKMVGVAVKDAHRFSTDLYFHSYGSGPEGVVQQSAFWIVDWTSDPQEGAKDEDHPLIEAIRVRDFQETTAKKPLFAEATGSVLGNDKTFQEQILRGGEHWYGKIDAVGELHYLGHNGIAIGDVDGDGLEDLYVAMGTGVPNKLYLANPDGTAREAAAAAGVDWLDDTKGVLLADMDNDGDKDLVLAIGPSLVVCHNDGKGKFVVAMAMRGATDASFYSLAAADFDLDGDLDLYGTRYVKVRYGETLPLPLYDANNGPPNHLMRNDGAKGFTDVTDAVGLGINNNRWSLAAQWVDFDDDGDPDLFVANDFGRNNLYRNDGGRFVDITQRAGLNERGAGMGVSWADYDQDGDLDLHVSNMFSSAGRRIAFQPQFKEGKEGVRRQIQDISLGNALWRNEGGGKFANASDIGLGVRMGRWAWGAMFVDCNNDGWEDIVSPNGFLTNPLKDDL